MQVNTLSVGNQPCKIKEEITLPDTCKVLEKDQDPHEFRFHGWNGVFSILTQEDGDKRIVWRANSIPEINDAKKLFDELIEKGFVPYKVGKDGKAAEVLTKFDPILGQVIFQEIVMVPEKLAVGG